MHKNISGQVQSKTETCLGSSQAILLSHPKLTRLIEKSCMVINVRSQEDEARQWEGHARGRNISHQMKCNTQQNNEQFYKLFDKQSRKANRTKVNVPSASNNLTLSGSINPKLRFLSFWSLWYHHTHTTKGNTHSHCVQRFVTFY